MKLIIDIDENVYTRLFDNGIQDNEIAIDDICEMARALRFGIPYEERPQGEWIGEWIYNQYEENPNIYNWHCSHCNYIVVGKDYKPNYNFCPNCGADMRGKEE